jgi:IS30 family transposase
MPATRELTMRRIRQMLRLARDGVSAREIGRTLGVARSTIQDNLKRAAVAGLAWPLIAWSFWRRAHQAAAQRAHFKSKKATVTLGSIHWRHRPRLAAMGEH